MNIDPISSVWKSTKYRKFIRNHMSCWFCSKELINEKESYEAHHHRHSGGKNPSDHMLIAMCLKCHNDFHKNESRFNLFYGMNDREWDKLVIKTLSRYIESLNISPEWVCINALREAAYEAE